MVKKSQVDYNDESSDSSNEKTSPTSASRPCDHVRKAVDSAKLRKHLKTTGLVLECTQCQKVVATSPANEITDSPDTIGAFEYDNTLWLCLKCGTQLCGRSKSQHALKHFKTPHSDSHALAINNRSFEIWCYECDKEVKADSRKNLLECVEFIKGLAQKPPVSSIDNTENIILTPLESLKSLLTPDEATVNTKSIIPLPPIPGMAKRINGPLVTYSNYLNYPVLYTGPPNSTNKSVMSDQLPRVRGLTNLGNTCFFNAVMQCLAQTPYLLDVLKESSEPGEEFTLPGGTFKSRDDKILSLPPIKGSLSAWGGLTAALAQTLEELQSGGGVFNPSKLFTKLCAKCPQFQGGDQHDSHELLRHLLESVRSEDLKRYQRVILQNLGYKDQDINTVSEELKQKCKIYGNQAADRILRPEQVFRGFLVSTLICQDCSNVSSRHEYFLDMSLPVSVEKSQPPQVKRKTSPDNSNAFFLHPVRATSPIGGLTKSQVKKEHNKSRKNRRDKKNQRTKLVEEQLFKNIVGVEIGASGDAKVDEAGSTQTLIGCATREDSVAQNGVWSNSSTSAEQSDADVEDNLMDDNEKSLKLLNTSTSSTNNDAANDANGNKQIATSPVEKRGDSPENMDKDSLDEDENDSGIATSPANAAPISFTCSSVSTSETNGEGAGTNSVISLGLSEKGANLVRQLTFELNMPNTSENLADVSTLTNGEMQSYNPVDDLSQNINKINLNEEKLEEKRKARAKAKRVRTQSNSDWATTFAPYYKCEDGECSVQSCLNNFTAIELMTANNKVGCEYCTKRINGEDPKAKTVYTNATKQFLISSPPAVLILHLKRFQLGPRCLFRKLNRAVNFPMILDVAPFCGSKVKTLPNINRKQKKLLYALYGVVEHSGNMYGGHYTAYVKVRSKLNTDDNRWKFIPQGSKAELDQDDEQRKKLDELLAREKARDLRMKAANDSDDLSGSCTSSDSSNTFSSCSSELEEQSPPPESPATDAGTGAVGGFEEASNVKTPLGKWYYVSDSRVTDASENEVLNAEAYLLFYERIY